MRKSAQSGSGDDAVGAAMRLAATPYTRPAPHVGPIRSLVAGRTDHLPMDVKPESFVIPADIVSGLGEGNTENGFHAFNRLFNLPGASAPAAIHGAGLQRADGGKVPGNGNVPIMAAGGEYVVPPEVVARIGGGDMQKGHKILNDMVVHMRDKVIKKLKKLPRPHK